MSAAPSDAFVFFGATGDLAYKQIFPALQALAARGHFEVPFICVARSGWNPEKLKERLKESLESHGGLRQEAYQKLCERLIYIDGDYRESSTYDKLCAALKDAKRPLYYLAIQPSMFSPTTRLPGATWKKMLASSDELKRAKATMPDKARPEAM